MKENSWLAERPETSAPSRPSRPSLPSCRRVVCRKRRALRGAADLHPELAAVPSEHRQHRRRQRDVAARRSSCSGPTTAGQPIESTAAVVDDVAYVGTAGGELIAIDMASGKAKWKYQAVSADYGIGVVVAGRRQRRGLRRRSAGRVSRRRRRDRQGALDPQDRIGDQVIAGDRRRQGADRLVRRQSLRVRGGVGQAGVESEHRELRACDARDRRTASRTSAAATRSFMAFGVSDGTQVVEHAARRLHRGLARRR